MTLTDWDIACFLWLVVLGLIISSVPVRRE
jgi:hypothetical protein